VDRFISIMNHQLFIDQDDHLHQLCDQDPTDDDLKLSQTFIQF